MENLVGSVLPCIYSLLGSPGAAPSGRPGPRWTHRSPRLHRVPRQADRVHSEPRSLPPSVATYLELDRHHRAAAGRSAAGREPPAGSAAGDRDHTQRALHAGRGGDPGAARGAGAREAGERVWERAEAAARAAWVGASGSERGPGGERSRGS